MTTTSDPRFLVLHALRVKGLASDEFIAAISGLSSQDVSGYLAALLEKQLISKREGRMAGSVLTSAGKEAYSVLLDADVADPDRQTALATTYETFLLVNGDFKAVCTDWQVRADAGEPNDHGDRAYDDSVVARLGEVHERITAVLGELASVLDRFSPYVSRLDGALTRVKGGEVAAFARPLADSYHDIWMELHADLLLSLQKERGDQDEG